MTPQLPWLRDQLPHHLHDELIGMLADRGLYGLEHADLLWRHHLIHGGSEQDAIAALTIGYHKAVWLPGTPGNESLSIDFWQSRAAEAGFAPDLVDAVSAAIAGIALHPFPNANDPQPVQWAVDLAHIDLAADRSVFERQDDRLRQHYSGIDDITYAIGRLDLFRKLLGLPAIFNIPKIRQLYQDQARYNLSRAVQVLERRLSRIPHYEAFN